MKNFTPADMPTNPSDITGGDEVVPVKDKHTDQINAAAGAEKGENPAGVTGTFVVADSKEAKKADSKEDLHPEVDADRNNAGEIAVNDATNERREETGVSKTTANREAKKAETRRKKTTS